MVVVALLPIACAAPGEDCDAILADEADPIETIEVVIRNTRAADAKVLADDECDQGVAKIDRATLPATWEWDLTDAGPGCRDLVGADTPREGVCAYPDPVDVRGGTEVAIPLRVLGFEPMEVPPACSDQTVCYARRPLPAGRYTVITWIGTPCPGPTPDETCAPCEPAGDPCRDGFYTGVERFEIDLDFPAQRSITIEI